MKKLKSKEGSLYMVFMKGFILLFLVIVGLAGILYGVNYFLPRRVVVMPKSYDIADYTNILEEEKYDRVPVTKTFARPGTWRFWTRMPKSSMTAAAKPTKNTTKIPCVTFPRFIRMYITAFSASVPGIS